MSQSPTLLNDVVPATMPDHLELPYDNGEIVQNAMEKPQTQLLSGIMKPWLKRRHPNEQVWIAHDCGIYWRFTDPPLDGCKAPDWYYVVGVNGLVKGVPRRSYVLWQEGIKPSLAIECVSRDGSDERDTTPFTGKFWVYEQGICIPYYAIWDGWKGTVELYRLDAGRYSLVPANDAGRYPASALGIELGLWQATIDGIPTKWLRVWDAQTGEMLPCAEEREETANALVDETRELLNEEAERARKYADKLRSLGIDPNSI